MLLLQFIALLEVFELYKFSWILWYTYLLSTKINPQQLVYSTMTVLIILRLLGLCNAPHHATHHVMTLLKFLHPIEISTSVVN